MEGQTEIVVGAEQEKLFTSDFKVMRRRYSLFPASAGRDAVLSAAKLRFEHDCPSCSSSNECKAGHALTAKSTASISTACVPDKRSSSCYAARVPYKDGPAAVGAAGFFHKGKTNISGRKRSGISSCIVGIVGPAELCSNERTVRYLRCQRQGFPGPKVSRARAGQEAVQCRLLPDRVQSKREARMPRDCRVPAALRSRASISMAPRMFTPEGPGPVLRRCMARSIAFRETPAWSRPLPRRTGPGEDLLQGRSPDRALPGTGIYACPGRRWRSRTWSGLQPFDSARATRRLTASWIPCRRHDPLRA